MKKLTSLRASQAISIIVLLLASSAQSQATATATDPLSPVEGVLQGVSESSPQRAIGRLIEDVCPGTLTAGNQFDLSPTTDLKQRCDEMWANALIGNDLSGVTAGLQGSANEEDAALGSSEVDVGSSSQGKIQSRISAARGGNVGGLALSFNGIDTNKPIASGAGDSASGSGWGSFIAGTYSNADRDSTDREIGFTSDTWGATGGIDYTRSDLGVLGMAFAYQEADADLSANSGSLETDTWAIYGYASYFAGPATHLDIMLSYSESSHDQDRNVVYTVQQIDISAVIAGTGGPRALAGFSNINQVASSDTDSDEFSVSAILGHDLAMNGVVIAPYVGISYADINIDGFRERMSNPNAAGSGLALFIDDQEFESLITKLGATATFSWQSPWGPIFPYVAGEYSHEYKNNNDPISGGFVDDPNGLRFSMATDSPDRNFFNFGAGFSASISDTSYFYARYNGLVGYKDLAVHAAEFGFLIGF